MTRPGREIDVVGAVILQPGASKTKRKILIVQRPLGEGGGGLWEFPGGKKEIGESSEQALKRELEEELDLRVRIVKKIGYNEHQYEGLKVKLELYYVECLSGFVLNEHTAYQWIDCEKIDPEILLEADRPFLKQINTEEV